MSFRTVPLITDHRRSSAACGCYGIDFRGHLGTVLHALPEVIPAGSLDVPWWRGHH